MGPTVHCISLLKEPIQTNYAIIHKAQYQLKSLYPTLSYITNYVLVLIRCQLAPPGTFKFLLTDLAGIQTHTHTQTTTHTQHIHMYVHTHTHAFVCAIASWPYRMQVCEWLCECTHYEAAPKSINKHTHMYILIRNTHTHMLRTKCTLWYFQNCQTKQREARWWRFFLVLIFVLPFIIRKNLDCVGTNEDCRRCLLTTTAALGPPHAHTNTHTHIINVYFFWLITCNSRLIP